jgi:glycosyltransferase involved in cell wall biosynthesis
MRILVDYRPALSARTGVGEYVHSLVRAYAAAYDNDLTAFTSSWKDRPSSALGAELGARVVDRRVPVSVLNFLWHRIEWPPVESLAGDVDIVHAFHPLLIPARRAAQVVTIHDLFFLDHPEQTRAEIRRDYVHLTARHAQRADAVITPSVYTKTLVSERLKVAPDRIYVCPPGAPSWQSLGREPRAPADGYILFLGTLEPRKNLGVLLDAYLELLDKARRVPRLLIAGGATPAAGPWLDRIARDPLTRVVSYAGYINNADRERLYAGARAVVLPSLDEGFGLTVLEAMSAGIPVLASNRGSLPEVVGPEGVLLDPHDTSAWASAIERVAADARWADSLGRTGLERARTFAWKESAVLVHQAYTDAVARRRER